MGAIYISNQFDASNNQSLKKQFYHWVSFERKERGEGAYQGVLDTTLQIMSSVFPDYEKADEYISKNTNKYGASFAVQVGDFSKAFFNSSKGKKLLEKEEKIASTYNNFDLNLLTKLKSQKSQFKSCEHCGSKISIKHFTSLHKTTECPVCQKEMLKTAKIKEEYNKLFLSYQQIQKEVKAAEKEHNLKIKNPPYWLVGGWASC